MELIFIMAGIPIILFLSITCTNFFEMSSYKNEIKKLEERKINLQIDISRQYREFESTKKRQYYIFEKQIKHRNKIFEILDMRLDARELILQQKLDTMILTHKMFLEEKTNGFPWVANAYAD